MHWALIAKLSLFGLLMALLTVAWIPANLEPVLWLVIFIVCALIIARTCSARYFLHGLLVSMANSVWITSAHVAFFSVYIRHHPDVVSMTSILPLSNHPRLLTLLTGPIFGVISGLILGSFSWVASKMVKKPAART